MHVPETTEDDARRRSVPLRVAAVLSVLSLVASACTRADVSSAVSVKPVPVDLVFGVKDLFAEKKAAPPAPAAPKVTIDLPVFDFDQKPPPLPEPQKSCVITQAGVRHGAPQSVAFDTKPEEGGTHSFSSTGTFVEDGKKVALEADTTRVVDVVISDIGRLPNIDNGPSADRRTGYRMEIVDGFTGIRTVYKVMPGQDPSQVNPEVGLFLQRIAFPHGRRGEYDANLTGGLQYIEPAPSPKLASFPLVDGSVESTIGYDPLTQLFVVSKATVLGRDNKVRTCGEFAAAFAIRWELSVGRLPDVGLLVRPACDHSVLGESVLPLLNPSAAVNQIRFITQTYRALIESRTAATKPVWDLFDELTTNVPDTPGRKELADRYEELRPTLDRVCNLDDGEVAFDAMNAVFEVQHMAGTQWHATQWGAFPIKDTVAFDGDYLTGEASSTIQFIQTLTGEL